MPNEKRARHKAYRQAKQAQLRRAQQRRRNLRRGAVVAAVVVAALVIAALTTLGGGKSKNAVGTTGKATTTTTAPATTTTTPASTTTLPLAAAPGSAAASPVPASLAAALTPRRPPVVSKAACAGSASSTTSASTTTVPAKGNAVSVVPAPAGAGFPKLDGTSPRYTRFSSPPPFCINVDDSYVATVKTTAGTFAIQLLPRYAPQTVNNFVFLADYHFYDGTVFHRVIPGFMDQGGDPTGTGSGGPGYSIPDEFPKTNAAYDPGAIAMANTGQPNSGGSQFFLMVPGGGKQLSPAYSMFGQVISGQSVVEKINAAGNSSPAANGVPPKTLYKIDTVSVSVSAPKG